MAVGWPRRALALSLTLAAQACSYRIVHDGRLNDGAVHRLVERTARTRNLPLKAQLPVELVEAGVLRAEVLRAFAESPERAKIKPYAALLKKFGLIPADMDLEAYVVDLLSQQIAGYYDPETKILRLVAGSTDLGGTLALLEKILQRDLAGEFLLSHELTHALGDQHFDLERFTKLEGNSDTAAARKAFAEGEAMLVGMHVVLNRRMKRVAFQAGGKADAERSWEAAPAVIKRQIVFEYVDGLNFASAVYAKGGTKGLDAVYERPPRSSEEILHPEKYLAGGEAPRAVSFSADPPALAGLARIDEDSLGEIGIWSLLEEPLGEDGARLAAAGWGGDRFRLYAVPDRPDDVGFAWRTAWDTAADRAEFAENLAALLTKRYGKAQRKAGARVWVTRDGRWTLEETGKDEAELTLVP